ncbi:hypothetical protein AVEN_247643-1 [Araneus ventricosus]|uniref:Uncharacterized protein n=1 Tax=Araneus ventricosus TaxID=182803 RepID=A0A4Y2TEU7_ARAVE|nr:hypothetical protein AVEN_212534-1 [Araneus ventricosus]GBN99153.1 hypothetical protein AVEN_247643-1 [Araneus ventricosus]
MLTTIPVQTPAGKGRLEFSILHCVKFDVSNFQQTCFERRGRLYFVTLLTTNLSYQVCHGKIISRKDKTCCKCACYLGTSHHTFDVLPKVALISRQWSRNGILFVTRHGPFHSYFKRLELDVSDNCACGEQALHSTMQPPVFFPFPSISKLFQ